MPKFGWARVGTEQGYYSMPRERAIPKFHRISPTLRREMLVNATLRCLKRYGHEGASIRRISAVAGVSIGLIHHHFPSKSGLVALAYETLARSVEESIRLQAEHIAISPRDRLRGFVRASFTAGNFDPQLFQVWLVFWSMVAYSPEIRAVHDRAYGNYRSILESLLRQLAATGAAPKLRLRPAAIGLSALLVGLWIELSLRPTAFKPSEAIALCESWTDALCRGSFPWLLSAGGTHKASNSLSGSRRR